MPEARLERTRQAYKKECDHEWIVTMEDNYYIKRCAKCKKEKIEALQNAK